MQSPVTAPSQKSIWNTVDPQEFYNSVNDLYNLHPILPEISNPSPGDFNNANGSVLPFEEERQLADDFALIGAHEHGVEFVTAATIEINEDLPELTVILAANNGVLDQVLDAFVAIFASLKRCAAKSMLAFESCSSADCNVQSNSKERFLTRCLCGRSLRYHYLTGLQEDTR